jgi:hypothetical protein
VYWRVRRSQAVRTVRAAHSEFTEKKGLVCELMASQDLLQPFMGRQVIITTVFGSGAEQLGTTFSTFSVQPNTELHAFVVGSALPSNRLPKIQYHLVEPDSRFVSVRRNALFRRWLLPDQLDAEYALVVDGTDVICVQPLPSFEELLRGASLAACTEWGGPVAIPGQGYTSTYLNAGITFWHLPSSKEMRSEIAERGRRHYRGPFDDQTALNEVMLTRYFEKMVILGSQFNWRAFYKKGYRTWQNGFRAYPRVDSLDGVYLYHNQRCLEEVLQAMRAAPPTARAELPVLPQDNHPLSGWALFSRRLLHRLRHT